MTYTCVLVPIVLGIRIGEALHTHSAQLQPACGELNHSTESLSGSSLIIMATQAPNKLT